MIKALKRDARLRALCWRAFFAAAVLLVEKLTLLHLPTGVLGGALGSFVLALIFFGWRRLLQARIPYRPLDGRMAALHGLCIGFILFIQHGPVSATEPHTAASWILFLVWTALIPAAYITLFGVAAPLQSLWGLLRSLGPAWIYAACTASFLLLRRVADDQWSGARSGPVAFLQSACFSQTQRLLAVFYPVVVSVPAEHLIGTPRYVIVLSWLCSGIEGLGLVTLLVICWLVYSRHELRLNRAILVAPLALLLTWTANIIRLAMLIAIGDHGHVFVARVAFHAQAGWITLNLVALGCLATVQHIDWFRKHPQTASVAGATAGRRNDTAVFLLPFTVILAASLFTQGISSYFETFYFLRVLVAIFVLCFFRAEYRRLDWRFGWPGVAAGAAVGLMWILIYMHFPAPDANAIQMGITLAHTTALKRWGWIGFRLLGAVVTVPIAEELAFRGFVARRTGNAEFQDVSYKDMGWISMLVSSTLFGLMHGRMWVPGIVAGAVFWLCAKLRNRLGEAVIAHAVANAVIAVAVLIRHDYSMW